MPLISGLQTSNGLHMSSMNRVFWGALGIVSLDQLAKLFVRQFLAQGNSIAIVPGFQLTHTTNTGVGFGLLQGMTPFVIGATVSILLWLFHILYSIPETQLASVTFALLIGGSIGNLIDRIVFGHVIDFLDFRIWPVFNVADAAVTCGGVLLLFLLSREERA